MWNEDSYSACILGGAGRQLAVNQVWGERGRTFVISTAV